MNSPSTVTALLGRWHEGEEVHARVMPLVYANLRQIAGSLFGRERADHTLQPTGLVNEAYIRLVESGPFKSREHFFGSAANAMRQTLVDYARRHNAHKRGASFEHVELDEGLTAAQEECREILAMEQALSQLEKLYPRQAEIMKLRYFTGLTVEEAADVMNIRPTTVKDDWAKARRWLKEQLEA
jgi:RNA polymerase sigma factor (TIGR02999 family)